MGWKKVSEKRPPQNKVVKTKIVDAKGERNEAELVLIGRLWYLPPERQMYIYYTPTHWYEAEE